MANEYQQALMESIDYLINNRVNQLSLDKTVIATVKECVDATTNQYLLNYNGGTMYAYAQDEASYTENQTVYVLVPQGDFSQTKIIVGKASNVGDDGNISFVSSALADYNLVGSNVLTEVGDFPIGLNSYRKEDYLLLYKRYEKDDDIPDNATGNLLDVDNEAFQNYLSQSEVLMIRAEFQTRLPRSHRMSMTGTYGLQFVLAFKTQDTEEGSTKYVSLVLDNSMMDGNPFLFTNYSSQYAMFEMDFDNFLYIDSIMAYSKDFVDEDDAINIDFYGDDIFIDDIEIYGLKEIDAVNGDYKLKLSTPSGTIFKGGASASSTLQAWARLLYKENTDLSDSATYYWFKEDPRVTSLSENYQMYGGSGWSYEKDFGSDYILTTTKSQNKAYENRYLCVCVYKQEIILKTEFSLFNDEAKRDMEIVSDLGTKFSFDRGTPTMTCLVDGKTEDFDDERPDSYYRFLWSKVDEFGQLVTFDKTKEELEQEYEEGIGTLSYSALVAIQNQITEMEGVTVDGNVLTYPVKSIMSTAKFKCSLYLKDTSDDEEYYAGDASIILYNEGAVAPADYYILIENGNQVFQYSESGVSPASERYADPQEILPLYCHFYDPAGLEVDESTYSLKWKVPTELTMLVIPTELTINPASEKYEWFVQSIYPTDIADEFDYQALNNQVTAIVMYDGQEFQKDSELTFLKVGDNGTNGTDVVCKIVPKNFTETYDDELFAVQADKYGDGASIEGSPTLEMEVYKSGQLAQQEYSVTWGISGGKSYSYPLTVSDGGVLSYKTEKPNHPLTNMVVQGRISEDGQTYYAYYPVCSIVQVSDQYTFVFKKTKSLKQILYNQDGRYPLYNKNQGISYALYDSSGTEMSTDDYSCSWTVSGGMNNDSDTSILSIEQEDETLVTSVSDFHGDFVQLVPSDVYTGEYCNHVVNGEISVDGTIVAYATFAVYIGLNRYTLSSLNAWDGNHIEINEDSNYILAPQIGAGIKESDNSFTGIVMGTASTYDPDDRDESTTVGLLGYHQGEQSILLDAETGKAVFGLPELSPSEENRYNEGRIELVPGGESKIGNWTIGSRSLYNMSTYEGTESPFSTTGSGDNITVHYDESKDNPIFIHEPDEPYKDYEVAGAQYSIPHTAQGVLLNSIPAYFSIKGMPLTSDNSDIDWTGANTTIREGDSLEVEIDPRKSSLFSIFRHTRYEKDDDTGEIVEAEEYHRYPLVGINSYGQFYSNAIEDGESSMGIGPVGAFKDSASSSRYMGAQFGYQSSNLLKFYIDLNDSGTTKTKTLHFSTGSNVTIGDSKGNEYPRAMHFHAKSFALYASLDDCDEQTTTDRLILGTKEAILGHEDAYLSVPSNANIEIKTADYGIDIDASKASTLTLGNTLTTNITGAVNNTLGSTLTNTIQSNVSTTITKGSYSLTAKDNSAGISMTTTSGVMTTKMLLNTSTAQMSILNSTSNNTASLALKTSGTSALTIDTGLEVVAKANPILIKNVGSAEGIELNALWNNSSTTGRARIKMIPASDGYSTIYMTTGGGQLTLGESYDSTTGGVTTSGNGATITPGVFSKYMVLTGEGTTGSNPVNGGYSLIAGGRGLFDYLTVQGKEGDSNGNALYITGGGVCIDGYNNDWHGLDIIGNAAITETLKINSLTVSEKSGMDQAWFDEIQRLYDHWDKSNYYPITVDRIRNMGFAYTSDISSDDTSWRSRFSSINNAGSSLASGVMNVSDIDGVRSVLSQFATLLYNV